MQNYMWLMLLYIFLAGAIGGVVNAVMTDNGFIKPKREVVDGKTIIWRPGYFGNILIGAVAAVVSWGLYGPLSSVLIAGTSEALDENVSPDKIGLTLAALVGAVMIGIGGARWLTNEVDKSLLKATAVKAAGAVGTPDASLKIAVSSPAQSLEVARTMR